jgi:hypothetical protein
MRIGLGSAAAALVVAAMVGCGGKVVIDMGNAAGGGGAGGSSSTGTVTTTITTTVTTSGNPMCGTTSCTGGGDGTCACQGECDGQKLEVQCSPIMGGASCTCIENGIKIAVCVQPGAASCSFVEECCGPQFFGQANGG